MLAGFHPITARWFAETFGQPTRAQARGWDAIRQRRHTLIAAPTGSGKTLAAFLTALDDLVHESLTAPLPALKYVYYGIAAVILILLALGTGFELHVRHLKKAAAAGALLVFMVMLFVAGNSFIFVAPQVPDTNMAAAAIALH